MNEITWVTALSIQEPGLCRGELQREVTVESACLLTLVIQLAFPPQSFPHKRQGQHLTQGCEDHISFHLGHGLHGSGAVPSLQCTMSYTQPVVMTERCLQCRPSKPQTGGFLALGHNDTKQWVPLAYYYIVNTWTPKQFVQFPWRKKIDRNFLYSFHILVNRLWN
jgi:hypothetical protein